ncbi:MAG: hypothetical protein Q9175_007030 [Cornicularia normoerica]
MPSDHQIVALAGVGDLGKYICEELLASPLFDVVVLSRRVPVYITDYSPANVLSIFEKTQATTVISSINLATPQYIDVHASLLTACQQSKFCKRLIPSEWIGDSESYPLKPDYYATTREPFRQMLREQTEIEWTLFNPGWLADYFLPKEKTYISPIPDKFPADPNNWRACIRGSGDEPQSWTCGREIGRAVTELCKARRWEQVTYVAGEWSTFNAAIKTLESFYGCFSSLESLATLVN